MTPNIELLDNQGSSSTSETVDNSKSITKTSDLHKMSNKSYEKQFPQLYYSAMEDGWYCKICSSFSDIRITDQVFEIRRVLLAIIQPADQTNIYHLLGTKKASKNKQAYDEL